MLQEFVTTGVFAFILTFVRIGTAITIMPGIGDTLTPGNVRLHIALALSFVMAPFIAPSLPHPVPTAGPLLALIGMEFVVGLFIGSVARILMAALDTAGMLMSIQSGLGSAQLFNPAFASQGSVIGTFLTIAGILVLFTSNVYRILFYGLVGSYQLFPVGSVPDPGSMVVMISKAISESFLIAVEIAAPFIMVTTLVYIGMGVLSRLMPQIQVFMLAMPLQILMSLLAFVLCASSCMLFWLSKFNDGMLFFFGQG